MSKTDKELMQKFYNSDYSDLSLAELQRIQALVQLEKMKEVSMPVPKDKIGTHGETKTKADGKNWFNVLTQKYEQDESFKWATSNLFQNTDSDAACPDDVSAWSPQDTYAKVVWTTFVCRSDLFGICVKGVSINEGDGLSVQIRTCGAFGDPTQLTACECASCASISFSTYTLTLHQYNLEAIICNLDIFDVGDALVQAYMDSMADSWSRWFDEQIYAQLETATEGTTITLPNAIDCSPALSGSCCSDTAMLDLYNATNEAVASMREGIGLAGPYSPDYMIVSPSVASIFKRMQTPAAMPWSNALISFSSEGKLSRVGSLKVIEYCGANSCTDDTGEVVAIIIDSRRAVGAVFGMRPKVYTFFQSDCNSTRIDNWCYFAVGELDTDAICHIVNP